MRKLIERLIGLRGLAAGIASAGFLAVALSGIAASADEGWLVDFEAAKQQAAKEGKSILMEFTGSDWCPPCIALKKKVLDTDQFKKRAPEKFVLLKLDNPNDKSKQTPAEIAQYRKLAADYKVSGVPTIILADDAGRPFAKNVGFGGQEPEAYVDNLERQLTNRAKRDDLLAQAAKAQGEEKAKLLDQAIAVVDAELAVSVYAAEVAEITKLDSENKAGLKGKFEGVVKAAEVRKAIGEIRRLGPTAEALAKMEELLTTLKPEGEALQEVLVGKGLITAQLGDKAAGKAILEQALAAAPNSRMARSLSQFLATQFNDGEESKDAPAKQEKAPAKP